MNSKHNSLLFPALLGTALGGSILYLSTKALLLMVGTICGIAMLLLPDVAYFTMVATIPIQMQVMGRLTVSNLVLPLALACIGANVLVHRCQLRNPFRWPEGHLGLLFFGIAFLSIIFVSVIFAKEPGLLPTGAGAPLPKDAGAFILYAVFYFTTLAFVQDVRTLRRLVWLLIVVGMIQAVITVAQAYFHFVVPGVAGEAASGFAEGYIRAEGSTTHPLFLAYFFQMVIPLAIAQLFWERRIMVRIWLLGGAALMLYAWHFSYARSSALAMIVMAIFALATSKVGRYLAVVLLGAALVALLVYNLSPLWLIQKFGDSAFFQGGGVVGALDSIRFRVEQAIGGWNLFLSHFFLGVGFGQSTYQYEAYLPSWATQLHPVEIHNAFIQAASEFGIMGLLAFLGLWASAFRYLQKAKGNQKLWPYPQALVVVLLGQFIVLLGAPWFRDIWLTLAMAAAIGRMSRGVS